MRCPIDRAGRVKQQALESKMVKDMQQRSQESAQRDSILSIGNAQHAQADADPDNTDIFNAGIGE
jgi:hypothetical protein